MRLLIFLIIFVNLIKAEDFEILDLNSEIKSEMKDVSWNQNCPVSFSDLKLLKIKYLDFQNQIKIGELVVHHKIADEVSNIFQILFKNNFNIRQIERIEKYNGNDNLSMYSDNTSAFNCRYISGTKKYSKHSYGIAIDINPVENPFVKNKKVYPSNSKKIYRDRDIYFKGKIDKNSIVYKTFKKYNWNWGGNWRCCKDYQHFEKRVNLNYF